MPTRTRSGHYLVALRARDKAIANLTNLLLDREGGWSDNGTTDTGIPDDRDSLVARIQALEIELQEERDANY